MSGSFGHRLRAMTAEEVRRNREMAARDNGRWASAYNCGNPKCNAHPAYVSRYSYVTGRAGRVSFAEKSICSKHAEAFAKKHGLPMPTEAAQ